MPTCFSPSAKALFSRTRCFACKVLLASVTLSKAGEALLLLKYATDKAISVMCGAAGVT